MLPFIHTKIHPLKRRNYEHFNLRWSGYVDRRDALALIDFASTVIENSKQHLPSLTCQRLNPRKKLPLLPALA